ncbi:MAG TPA: dTDP-4-dehydrorhamnose reductase [Mobilitalea sp.]|nr:dTDP-4-dehydrorhamnose reductase [Mobilitalea sp.]
MKKILITGASGQLGQALNGLLKQNNEYRLYLTDSHGSDDGLIKKMDISDEAAVEYEIQRTNPDIIINCAAMTAVDLCEKEKELAYKINSLGPKYLAITAEKTGAKLIHISTDYIYDGQAKSPYTEEAKANPINVYGQTKLEGDNFVLKYCKKSFVLHTAWLYGKGKNFVKTMLRMAGEGKRIRVVSDQIGSPTSALELARVIMFLMETESYGKYHATCEGSTSWYGFAVKIFELAGLDVEVEPITSDEYLTPAKRPAYSVLDNKRLREEHGYYMKDWIDALQEYMESLKEKNL